MNLFKSSIKLQFFLAYSMLAIPLILLSISSLNILDAFKQSIRLTNQHEHILTLTSSLERDVIDLQRNILIYKDTASQSAVGNAENLYQNIVLAITDLKKFDSLKTENDSLARMSEHLAQYQSSFAIVILNKNSQTQLIKDFIESSSPLLSITAADLAGNLNDAQHALELTHVAQKSALSYFVTIDTSHIKSFRTAIASLENLSRLSSNSQLLNLASQYKESFIKIVNTQRNYVFLINVVMAGSAREILFFADKLTQQAEENSAQIRANAVTKLKNQSLFIFGFLALGMLMVASTPLYFSRLVITPIQKITATFNSLVKGEDVTKIPGLKRKDEIGLLANAADVFKLKNDQAHELLEHAKTSMQIQMTLNDDLEHAKQKAEKALTVKSDFLANMSHELRTPLNSVIGYTVRLIKNSEGFSDRHLSSLKAIERNGKHLLAMINDILDLSKIDANKLELRFEETDLFLLCEGVIDQMHAFSDEKGIKLIYEPPCYMSRKIVTDPIRLTQMLINLISNGIKYTKEGSVTLKIVVDNKSNWVQIQVSDTGIGISIEDRVRLFNRFEQFDDETRHKIGHGTGLGLAIVDKISHLLNAKITVDSELNHGSCFTISLPFDGRQSEVEPQPV